MNPTLLSVLLHGLLEESSLRAAPVLHLVTAEDGPSGGHKAGEGGREVVVVRMKCLVCMEDRDVSACRGGRHVQARLLHARAAIKRACKGPHGARDDDELVDLILTG